MKKRIIAFILCLFPLAGMAQTAQHESYLESVRQELLKRWPQNRTINLVFHGHSVPSGYARTPQVNTLDAYPYRTLAAVKALYPTAVVNSITTSIGGENSEQGAVRFIDEVLCHRPDVLFIDYALNDRTIGPERAERAWRGMIEAALARGIKVILCTPTPDLTAKMTDASDPLSVLAQMVRNLAAEYHVGLADFYARFVSMAQNGEDLSAYMAQVNHPNAEGHRVAVDEIVRWFAE